MDVPFSTEAFFEVFRSYNEAIWPAPLVAALLGSLAIYLTISAPRLDAVRRDSDRTPRRRDRFVGGTLALFWIWMGLAYHAAFFSEINPAAYLFGGFFVLQGLLFTWTGVAAATLRFSFRSDLYGWSGAVLVLYATVVYPLVGYQFGHVYPSAPVFGVAPCPTTIFTFGILLWTRGRVPGWLLIVPAAWSVVGLSAALQLEVPEDFGLIVAGVIGTSLLLVRNRTSESTEGASLAPS